MNVIQRKNRDYEVKKNLLKIFGVYFLVSCIVISLSLFKYVQTNSLKYPVYIWNLGLAWIPFICSLCISYREKMNDNRVLTMLLVIVWFFFFPNSIYIVTDYIHISVYNYNFKIEDTLEFNKNFGIWYDFILISITAFTGYLLGFVSLYLNQSIIKEKINAFVSWIFTFVVMILSSYGIYLGRFVRWNSWDVLTNPLNLINSISDNFTLEAMAFTGLFTLFSISIYFIIYSLINNKFACNN